MKSSELVFLKLGGSLITDKDTPSTAKPGVIQRIAQEISQGLKANPGIRLILGHGSGSFGHASAAKYQTHEGGESSEYWQGFSKVWQSARQLNEIIIEEFSTAGLPVIAFPPSAGVIARDRSIARWDIEPLQLTLSHGLIPVVMGDVVFDTALGGTILSTEQIFKYLAPIFRPHQILLAGSDAGVYLDPDQSDEIIPHITPSNISTVLPYLSGSSAADVTGGMLSKVRLMLSILNTNPSTQIQIFAGSLPGNVNKVLNGEVIGTLITETR